MKIMGSLKHILGINVHRNMEVHTVHLSQSQYINVSMKNYQKYDIKLYATPMDCCTPYSKVQCPAPDSPESIQMQSLPYRELIGTLLWVANGTRPDIAYAVGTLAKFTNTPGEIHWKALLRVLGYLAQTINYCIRYRRDPSKDNGVEAIGFARGILPQLSDFKCYVDANYAGDIDTRRSTTGYLFKISDGPVSWQSRMQTSEALSSMESEYMAASAAAQEAIWLNRLLQQLGFRTSTPTTLYEDNKAAILFADHPGDHRRTKHIHTKKYFVRDAVNNGEIELVYVPTAEQLADGMTKALTPELHRVCLANYLKYYIFPTTESEWK